MQYLTKVFAVAFLVSWLLGCRNARTNDSISGVSTGGRAMNGTIPPPAGPTLVPGSAIGLVRLGMTRAEIAALGLDIRPDPSGQMGEAVRLVGPYQVLFDRDRVASVAFKLTGSGTGLVVGGRALSESATVEDLARLLPNCGPAQVGEGGMVISCGGGTTLLKAAAGSPTTVEVQVLVPGFVSL